MRRLITFWMGLWLAICSPPSFAQSPGPSISQDGLPLQTNASSAVAGTPINVGGYAIITYQVTAISGTATIVPESSLDATNYNTLTCYALDGTTSVTSFSGTGTWRCNVTGQNWARARISSCVACTVSVQATKWVSGQVSKAPTHIPVTVPEGGTGDTTLASGAYLKGAGTSPVATQAVPIPCSDGGTGLTSGTSGGVLAYTGTCTLASSGALTQHGVVIGGGAGATPTSTGTGTSGQFLISNGSGADPTFQTKTIPTVPISPTNGGTGIDTSGSTGVPSVSSGTWSMAATLATTLGGTGVNTSARFKLLNTSRDMTAASGTASVAHGVTGTPKAVVVFAVREGGADESWGTSDGSTNYCVRQQNTGPAGAMKTNAAIWLTSLTDTDNQSATITFDATNVNLVWTKTGSPTGTGSIVLLVFF